MARTAGGALENVSSDLNRMRELAIQSQNGTVSEQDKVNLNAEFQALKEGVGDQMQAEFMGMEMFSGQVVPIMVDPDGDSPIDLKLPDGADFDALTDLEVATSPGGGEALAAIDEVIDLVGVAQAGLGAAEGALASALRDTANKEMQIARAESRIADADAAREVSVSAAADLMENFAIAMQIHQDVDAELVGDLLSAPF